LIVGCKHTKNAFAAAPEPGVLGAPDPLAGTEGPLHGEEKERKKEEEKERRKG